MKRVLEFVQDCWTALCIFIILLVLSGCATTQGEGLRVVDLPEPPVLTECVSGVPGLPKDAADGTVIQTLFADYVECKAKQKEALRALDVYRKPAPGTAK